MAARAFMILLLLPFTAHSLQGMNDDAMSDVVAKEGIRLLTEYEATIDSVQYFDDKSPSDMTDSGGGSLSFVNMNIASRSQQIIDIEVVDGDISSVAGIDRSDRVGVRLSSQELPVNLSVGDLKINGESLGRVGLVDLTSGGVSPIIFDLWAGGYDSDNDVLTNESGLTLDVIFPRESSHNLYYAEDGARLSANINYCADADCNTGGLALEGITFDVIADGLRLGLPTIKKGTYNVSDFRIGVSDEEYSNINELSLSNINMASGGYLVLGAPTAVGETAVTFDMELADTSFDFVFYDTSDSARDSISANIQLTGLGYDKSKENPEDPSAYIPPIAMASGEINVLETTAPANLNDSKTGGLHVDFEAAFQVVATDITMKPDGVTNAPVLGTIELNLQILNGSYLEVMGH